MDIISPDQNKIIDAAFKRFAFFGHEKTTMAQIAKDLGYSRTFLYYYFPDKESIFKKALIRSADTYLNSLKKLLKKDITGAKMLDNGIKTKILCAKDFQILGVYSNQTMFRLLIEDLEVSYIFSDEKKLLAAIINKGKKDGSIIKCNTAQTVEQVTDGLIGYMSLGLRKLCPDHRITAKEMKVLLKRQLEFGQLLVKALETK